MVTRARKKGGVGRAWALKHTIRNRNKEKVLAASLFVRSNDVGSGREPKNGYGVERG
jgi:hypothetical protein